MLTGGNTIATLQTRTVTQNQTGEHEKAWTDAVILRGWLDLGSGNSKYLPFAAKVQESTHMFISQYVPMPEGIKPENARLVIGGEVYDLLLMDNPMGMNAQWELYLKLRWA